MSKSSRIAVDQLPARYQNQVAAQLAKSGSTVPGAPLVEAAAQQRRLRQSHAPVLNKLETDFRDTVLAKRHPDGWLYAQQLRYQLANGLWYKPDFVHVAALSFATTAYEVKGPRAFRGGFENLKSAARLYPWIAFLLVWKNDRGEWFSQKILP